MIEVIKNQNGELSFVLRGISSAYANALRRTTEEIPVLAIDEVEISKNDSVLYDEVLSHRIGLVPLKYPSVILRLILYFLQNIEKPKSKIHVNVRIDIFT